MIGWIEARGMINDQPLFVILKNPLSEFPCVSILQSHYVGSCPFTLLGLSCEEDELQ